MLLLQGPQQVCTGSCVVSISTQTLAWCGNILALLGAPLAGRDFSHLSFCCALRRCLTVGLSASLLLLLFASCLRQPLARGLEGVTTFSRVICSGCLWLSCHEPSPLGSLLQVMVGQNEPRASLALQGGAANEVLFMQRRQKHRGRRCRCDWGMLLQKWTRYLGRLWSCSVVQGWSS